jgi:hypothetical protein
MLYELCLKNKNIVCENWIDNNNEKLIYELTNLTSKFVLMPLNFQKLLIEIWFNFCKNKVFFSLWDHMKGYSEFFRVYKEKNTPTNF